MRPNAVLSTQLKVKNLLKGDEVAVFKLLNMDRMEPGREDKTRPDTYALSARKTVIDPFDENIRQKIIGNVVGQEQKRDGTGKLYYDDKVESVKFYHGYLTLKAEQNNTFEYVMRHPQNESNPFAKKMAVVAREKTPLFKLVNDRNEIKSVQLIEDMRYQAQKMVRETLKASELKALATKLNASPDNRLHVKSYNPPTFEDVQAIKYEILQKVPLFAKQIIAASGDQESKLKVQILEGLSVGVLAFDEGAFHLIGADTIEMRRPAPDVDKTDDLIQWFMTTPEGQKMYKDFTAEVRKAMKVDLKN